MACTKTLVERLTLIGDFIRANFPSAGTQKWYLPGDEENHMPTINTGISAIKGYADQTGYERGVTDGTATGYNQGHEAGFGDGMNAGMNAQKNQWWYNYQTNSDGSVRTNYAYAFSGTGWNNDTFTPTQNLTVVNATMMFYLSRISGSLQDFLGDKTIDFSGCAGASSIFTTSQFTALPALNFQKATTVEGIFRGCASLVSVGLFTVNKNTVLTNAFVNCTALENITFGGAVAKSADIHWSTKLSAASIKSLLSVLTETVTGVTITLPVTVNGQDTLTLLQTDTELAPLYTAAIEKGYSIAFA